MSAVQDLLAPHVEKVTRETVQCEGCEFLVKRGEKASDQYMQHLADLVDEWLLQLGVEAATKVDAQSDPNALPFGIVFDRIGPDVVARIVTYLAREMRGR